MNILGFGSRPVDIRFSLKGADKDSGRLFRTVKTDDTEKVLPIFRDKEDITGTVHLTMKKAHSRIDHQGIRIEFIGQIETAKDRSNHQEFVALSKLLVHPGDLSSATDLAFDFLNAEKPYESYYGQHVKLRYFLRLTIVKRFTNIVEEEDIYVFEPSTKPSSDGPKVSMEVGIEDSLHIEIEYLKSSFHLKDVIIGKVFFALVRIKVKHIELNLTRKETVGSHGNVLTTSDVLAKYEILDGAPAKGESIPIRFFLSPYDLTPTMLDVLGKFSVTYSLNLLLVDDDDRRYFKQQDITIWRKAQSEFLKLTEKVHCVTTDVHSENSTSKSAQADEGMDEKQQINFKENDTVAIASQ